jgi:hypothetical protein
VSTSFAVGNESNDLGIPPGMAKLIQQVSMKRALKCCNSILIIKQIGRKSAWYWNEPTNRDTLTAGET